MLLKFISVSWFHKVALLTVNKANYIFKRLRNKFKKCFIFIYIFKFPGLFILLCIFKFLFIYFFLPEEIPLAFIVMLVCWWWIFLAVIYLEIFLFYFYIWNIFLLGMEFQIDGWFLFLYFQCFKGVSPLCFDLHCFWWEVWFNLYSCSVSYIFFPTSGCF